MAKLPLIEIIPIPVTRYTHNRRFVDAGTAADFMIGRNWCDWQLWIHSRLYEWPKEHSFLKRRLLINHIIHCIDTDIAFYGYD